MARKIKAPFYFSAIKVAKKTEHSQEDSKIHLIISPRTLFFGLFHVDLQVSLFVFFAHFSPSPSFIIHESSSKSFP
jgi:hypothetical protein